MKASALLCLCWPFERTLIIISFCQNSHFTNRSTGTSVSVYQKQTSSHPNLLLLWYSQLWRETYSYWNPKPSLQKIRLWILWIQAIIPLKCPSKLLSCPHPLIISHLTYCKCLIIFYVAYCNCLVQVSPCTVSPMFNYLSDTGVMILALI